jgi:type II secretory pathway pseudopilin PulG
MRNQKGITLIALVITIIVLLILAGVTIAMLSGENGILSRATTTKAENAKAQGNEQAKLAYMTVRTEIAAQKVADGSFVPSTHGTVFINGTKTTKAAHTYLAELCAKDLNVPVGNIVTSIPESPSAGWTVVDTSSAITLIYADSSLENRTTEPAISGQKLVYTISLTADPVTLSPASY